MRRLCTRIAASAAGVIPLIREAAPIVPGRPDLMAEVAIAARYEQARSVADVLLRRTRLGLLAAPQLRDADSVRPLAATLGAELGWSEAEIEAAAGAWPEDAVAEGIDPARAARAA